MNKGQEMYFVFPQKIQAQKLPRKYFYKMFNYVSKLGFTR